MHSDRPTLAPSGSSGGIVVTPGSESRVAGRPNPNQSGLESQKGVHGFEFAFIIPCDAPPYERSPFGRVRYIIQPPPSAPVGPNPTSNAGATSTPWSTHPGQRDHPLQSYTTTCPTTVGLVSIACTSNNISVGGRRVQHRRQLAQTAQGPIVYWCGCRSRPHRADDQAQGETDGARAAA